MVMETVKAALGANDGGEYFHLFTVSHHPYAPHN